MIYLLEKVKPVIVDGDDKLREIGKKKLGVCEFPMKIKYIAFLVMILFVGNYSMADKMIVDDMKNQSGTPDEEFVRVVMLSGVLLQIKLWVEYPRVLWIS